MILVLVGAGGASTEEFQVNQSEDGSYPSISHDSSGGFVAAWQSYGRDGSGDGVFMRRFSSAGSALDTDFQVNQYTTNDQANSTISHDSSGGFTVAWDSIGQDGSSSGVFARRFNRFGSPVGVEFRLNQHTNLQQSRAAISHDPSGGFVVAWASKSQDGSNYGVFARRFASSGAPLGGEFQVNQYTTLEQDRAKISHDPSGGFVVAWASRGQDGSHYGVFARRFDSSGSPLGGELQVNQYTTGIQTVPALSHDPSGDFVVAWQSDQDGSGYGIFAQRFSGFGNPLGAEFQVNQYTTGSQRRPAISHDPSGRFVVTWESFGQDGHFWSLFARRFDDSGSTIGGEFQVNQYTLFDQEQSAISHGPSGGFVVAWRSCCQGGSYLRIFGRRFAVPTVLIDGALMAEGQSGSENATFLVLLSESPAPWPLNLEYDTSDGTASAGGDYTSTSGTLSIPPGQTWGVVSTPVLGDALYEADEFFWIDFSSSGLADFVDPSALGVIFNDDDPPSMQISDLQIVEGNAGTSTAQFAVSISQASGLPARVDFSTLSGTATAGVDYSTASGQLLFPAMSTTPKTASVQIHGDTVFEPDETFFIQLADPVDASVGDGLAVGTILND
ncbi:MAG TPA: Calx-beta domain-containing protein, partial [Acidobacteriota bacterium]